MPTNKARGLAVSKLIAIYNGASEGTTQQMEAIAALGRVGGEVAAEALVSIYNEASQGTKQQYAAIKALGEVGRVS